MRRINIDVSVHVPGYVYEEPAYYRLRKRRGEYPGKPPGIGLPEWDWPFDFPPKEDYLVEPC